MKLSSGFLSRFIEIFGVSCYLKAKFKNNLFKKSNSVCDGEIPGLRDLLRTIRVMKGTMAGGDENLEELKKMAQKQLYLSTLEFSIYFFALRHPHLFIKYVIECLYPVYKGRFGRHKDEGARIYFVNNFIGGKTAILFLIADFMKNGGKSLVFVDEGVFNVLKRMFRVILESIGGVETPFITGPDRFILNGSHFIKYFGESGRNSEIVFLNSRKKENLYRALHYFKSGLYCLVMIPETAAETKRKITVEMLGRELMLPGGIGILLKKASSVVSVLPDASLNPMLPELIIKEYSGNFDKEALLQIIVKSCERLSYVRPDLYLPFNFPSMWKNLYPMDNEIDKSIVDILPLKEKCLILLSDGQFLIGSRHKLKEFV